MVKAAKRLGCTCVVLDPTPNSPAGQVAGHQIVGDYHDPAKLRELVTFMEMHLELVARRLYAQAFFGGTVAPEVIESVRKELTRNIAAFGRLAKFAPYVGGAEFSVADCAASASQPSDSICISTCWTAVPELRTAGSAASNCVSKAMRR